MSTTATLHAWEESATPIVKLVDAVTAALASSDAGALEAAAREVARSVLVYPAQPVDALVPIVEAAATRATPELRLGVLDLVNALVCTGAKLAADHAMRAWLPALATVGPPLAKRLRVGFASIAYGELLDIAPEYVGPVYGGQVFPNDLLALLGYATALARAGGSVAALAPAWRSFGDELGPLVADGQLDEPTLLWIARALHEGFVGEPVDRVAKLAHDTLWKIPGELTRADEQTGPRPFPVGDTLAAGRFAVERLLRGTGAQRLYLGREVATGARVLVALDDHAPRKQNVEELARTVDYAIDGVFELAHVGAFDTTGNDPTRDVIRRDSWTMVERVPVGDWLPHVLGPADPWTAPTKAVELGRSAGRILLRAAAAGVVLAQIRPELMWCARSGDHYEVTGLSTRAIELFARKRAELPQHALFDRYYHAPEIHDAPDDRAMAYALAVMIAEWATGRYPFDTLYAPDGVETAAHVPIDAPAPLARLLERTIRRDRAERPSLAEFIARLDEL